VSVLADWISKEPDLRRNIWVLYLRDQIIPLGAYSYIIYKEHNKTFVKNGLSGQIEYSSDDDADAIQYVINNLLSSGGKIVVVGEMDLGGRTVAFLNKSRVIVEGLGGTKVKNGVVLLYGDSYYLNRYNIIRDIYFENVKIRIENGFNNSIENCVFSGGDIAIELINTKEWTEFTRIINVHIINPSSAGIAFRTPIPPGSDSYIHTYMETVMFNLDAENSVGILVENGANVSDSEFRNIRLWTSARSASMVRFNGNAYRTLMDIKCESLQPSPTSLYCIDIGSDSNWLPRLINFEWYGVWTLPVNNPYGKWIPGLSLFRESVSVPIGTNNSYGNEIAVVKRDRALNGILNLKLRITWGGTFGTNETVTVKIIFELIDGTRLSIEKSSTSAKSLWLIDDDFLSLYPGCKPLNAVYAQAKTNLSSTSVSVSIDVLGSG